jgi:hypothetical protein
LTEAVKRFIVAPFEVSKPLRNSGGHLSVSVKDDRIVEGCMPERESFTCELEEETPHTLPGATKC